MRLSPGRNGEAYILFGELGSAACDRSICGLFYLAFEGLGAPLVMLLIEGCLWINGSELKGRGRDTGTGTLSVQLARAGQRCIGFEGDTYMAGTVD